MNVYFRFVFLALCIAILFSAGCIQKTITDKVILDDIDLFLATPPDPSNPDLLTAEERSAVESYEVYREKIKIHLVQGSDEQLWKSIGSKMVKRFAVACRNASVLEVEYLAQMYIVAEDNKGEFKALVGDINFENNSDRVRVEMYKPLRSSKN